VQKETCSVCGKEVISVTKNDMGCFLFRCSCGNVWESCNVRFEKGKEND